MFVAVQCPCGKTLRAPADAAGKKVRCSSCGAVTVIPETDEHERGLATKPALPKARAVASDAFPAARRRRLRDDDEEWSPKDRSAKQGKGGLVILSVVAFLVAFGCVGLSAGGVVFYLASRKDASSKDQPAGQGVELVGDYYPLKVGTQWHYRTTVNGKDSQVTTRLSNNEMIDGQLLARLDAMVGGNTIAVTEHLTATANGVFRNRVNGIPVQPPYCMLKYPIKEGDSWKSDYVVGKDRFSVVSTCTKAEVTVPAGKYTAIKVYSEALLNGQSVTIVFWYAEGVGPVKEEVEGLPTGKITMELERFELGK
jgi:hypothetical protein